jgi:hypothetical protein
VQAEGAACLLYWLAVCRGMRGPCCLLQQGCTDCSAALPSTLPPLQAKARQANASDWASHFAFSAASLAAVGPVRCATNACHLLLAATLEFLPGMH